MCNLGSFCIFEVSSSSNSWSYHENQIRSNVLNKINSININGYVVVDLDVDHMIKGVDSGARLPGFEH